MTLPMSSHGQLAGGGRSCRDECWTLDATIKGQLIIVRTKGRQTILGGCCARWMLCAVDAVRGVCCTRCMLDSVYAALSVCCTQR